MYTHFSIPLEETPDWPAEQVLSFHAFHGEGEARDERAPPVTRGGKVDLGNNNNNTLFVQYQKKEKDTCSFQQNARQK